MLHVRILFHRFRVLAIFGNRRQDKFVILLAIVLQDETDLFPPSHLNARGLVTHLPASLEHLDVDDACGLFRITRLAGREMSVVLMSGRRTRHCNMRRQYRSNRCQKDANGDDYPGTFQHTAQAPAQCPLWLLPGLTALGPALGWAAGPFRRGDGADEFATSYATVACGCL